jgi:DNA gyrase subunit B
MFVPKPAKLEDCAVHGAGSGAELFIVEGDSASSSVAGVRNHLNQAVLPMQGKPLNAQRAAANKVLSYDLFVKLSQATGVLMIDADQGFGSTSEVTTEPNTLKFEKVLLLFDPDADGIHCGALMLMFLHRWMRPLLASGRVEMVRAPLFEVTWVDSGGEILSQYTFSIHHNQVVCEALRKAGALKVQAQHFRGLGSITPSVLHQTCIAAVTRKTSVMGLADAVTAMEVFGT